MPTSPAAKAHQRLHDASRGGPVRGGPRSLAKASPPYPSPHKVGRDLPPAPAPTAPCDLALQAWDACEFIHWVIAQGLDAEHKPTAALRAVAQVWLRLGAHVEGGKTLVVEKQGKVVHAAAHTPAHATAWRDTKVAPPEHHMLLRAIEERLRVIGELPVLRALRAPWLRERDKVTCGGTRFVQESPGHYSLRGSTSYGFAPGEEARDMIATFHAYLCYAADIPIEVSAAHPLQDLAARTNRQLQALRAR